MARWRLVGQIVSSLGLGIDVCHYPGGSDL